MKTQGPFFHSFGCFMSQGVQISLPEAFRQNKKYPKTFSNRKRPEKYFIFYFIFYFTLFLKNCLFICLCSVLAEAHWIFIASSCGIPCGALSVGSVDVAYRLSEASQLCPTLGNPMDCSLPGSSLHGIFQARVLEWVAFPFSRGSS